MNIFSSEAEHKTNIERAVALMQISNELTREKKQGGISNNFQKPEVKNFYSENFNTLNELER